MSNIQNIKNTKKGLKARLTQFKNFVDKLSADEHNIQPKEIELRISKVEPILDIMYDIQNQIISLDTEVDSEVLDKETIDFENDYFRYLGKAKTHLEELKDQ